MLGGELAVVQAPMFDGLPFDPFSLFYDGIGPAEIGVGGGHIVQAPVHFRSQRFGPSKALTGFALFEVSRVLRTCLDMRRRL